MAVRGRNLIFLLLNSYLIIESVKIEFPANRYIEERLRQDLKVIDSTFRSYITPREVLFQSEASRTSLPYFVRCRGSRSSVTLTIPDSATEFLILETNSRTHTQTAKLKTNRLTKDLVGRYSCSEAAEETSVHVFVQDNRWVFTRAHYPSVFQNSATHLLHVPCQTTTWFPQLSSSSRCNSQSACIPVSYAPSELSAKKVFFDPQIGFLLTNPTVPNEINELICQTESAPRHQASIAYTLPLAFKNDLSAVVRLNRKTNENVELDCLYTGRPKPKIVWYKGKKEMNRTVKGSGLKFKNDYQRLYIERAQAADTGYYTCELVNGRTEALRRSFDLRVQGTNPKSKLGVLVSAVTIISALLVVVMFAVLVTFLVKFCRMKRYVHKGIFHEKQGSGNADENRSALSQLYRLALPENFASRAQIHAFLNYVNGKTPPSDPEDFKELGRGQFGVVYQVRLPEIDLVAAKMLPEAIRSGAGRRREKSAKRKDSEEDDQMIDQREEQRKKAAEMLIDEIKVMHKAGKHVNIVALKKVAYPETKASFVFTGGTIRHEDSFYLMELCANGSLESLLKRFQLSNNRGKRSLYETLLQQPEAGMTVDQAYAQCDLTDDDLKLIAYQVASGVDYLNRKQIAHCDIAARNVLVTSRFIMKICDFGLATWTTYKNYREQQAKNETVQLEKKTNEIATHNLTPELARDILRASTPDERLLLNKSSMKADVWSFGIFLWTLFLKCRMRPFDRILTELQQNSSPESFFHRLTRIISEGRVLRYIDYHNDIPRNIYGVICECLVEESARPEMTRIRAYLCHSTTLSKQAFEFYRMEYNQYQESNAVDGNVELLAEEQGVPDLPSFDGDYGGFDPTYNSLDIKLSSMRDRNTYYPEPSDVAHRHLQAQAKRPAPPPPRRSVQV